MDLLQIMIGNIAGILGFVMIAAGVAKVFQVATTLNEMKDLLADIKRGQGYSVPAAPPALYSQSGEEMLRALSDAQEQSVHPEIINPR